ncbi:MAG: T9SS type A sorting domain-containing protein [Saprospiraceae bacterium]|nr:T9SS type A sorting domain-containing protein [Saprospiraceae bacterium]
MKNISIIFLALTISSTLWFCSTKNEIVPVDISNIPPDDLYLLDKIGIPDEAFLRKVENEIIDFKKQQAFRNPHFAFPGKWSTQGPGNLGGRVNTIAVHPDNENIIFIGFSHGGAYRTLNGGAQWVPVFDQQSTLYVSDIVFDPQNPNILYIATGDHSGGFYCGQGAGVFKSTDLGNTWTYSGLKETRVISELAVNPKNPQIVYAASLGYSYGKNEHRGLYKSNDAGKNWTKVFYLNDSAGITDIAMHPTDPDVLYIASWNKLGTNNRSFVVGPDGQIFKTSDGGTNWIKLTNGLPSDSINGRIALALSESNPDILYARYVRTYSCNRSNSNHLYAIYKTENAGTSWKNLNAVSDSSGLACDVLGGFGWYFRTIAVNPKDADDLLVLGVDIFRSLDGGKNWFPAAPDWSGYEVHADKHDLVFLDNGDMLLGTDGGLYRYMAADDEWKDIEDIPTNQIYRVAYNPNIPDLYYGGLQDNGSTGGNQMNISEWERIFGGDGFQMEFKPGNPDIYYAEYQNGNIWQYYNGDWRSFTRGISGTRNWDFPYMISRHDHDKLLAGSTSVYVNYKDTAAHWVAISPNLVANGKYPARSNPSITSLDESPLDSNVIIAGTLNGNVWSTNEFLNNWKNISAGLPQGYITSVKCSYFDKTHFFVTLSGHRGDDFKSYVYKTINSGQTWTSIQGNLPDLPIYDILVYPSKSDSVLFIGNHIGVYASIDGGKDWKRVGDNMPFIEVFDLGINDAEQTLVAGTYGKSIMSFPLQSILKPIVDNKNEYVEFAFEVYPNPATQSIQLNYPQNFKKIISYQLINMFGKIVGIGTLDLQSNDKINIQQLENGIYFIRLKGISNPLTFLKI